MAALWTRRDATERSLRVWLGLLPWILPFSSSPDPRASSSLSVPVAIVSSAVSPTPAATHRRPGASSSLSVPVAIVVISSAISPAPAAPHRQKVILPIVGLGAFLWFAGQDIIQGSVVLFEMSSSQTSSQSTGMLVCRCLCGLSAIILTSHTKKNPGRRFLRCSHFQDATQDCGFFRWLDGKSTDEISLHSADGSEILKQADMYADFEELITCVAQLKENHQAAMTQMKMDNDKEIGQLKEENWKKDLELTYIRRKLDIHTVLFCVIFAILCFKAL